MNTFNFEQTGGYPLETSDLQRMADSFGILNALGAIGGDNTILSGCNETGGFVTDGYVYYNGQVHKFKGGNKLDRVKRFKEPVEKTFENGTTKIVGYDQYLSFTSNVEGVYWTDFIRFDDNLRSLQKGAVPTGVIIMWSGDENNIPEGYAICNGDNGTPDLRSRFIVGKDAESNKYDDNSSVQVIKRFKTVSEGTVSATTLPEHYVLTFLMKK